MDPKASIRLVLALTVVAVVLPAPVAGARNACDAPPGTSGIEQYCEKLPAATGRNSASTPAGVLHTVGPSAAERLKRAGADGVGVLSLPAGTGTRDAVDREPAAPDQPSESPLKAVGSGVGSGSSVGGGFIWALVAVALALAALALLRFRRDPGN